MAENTEKGVKIETQKQSYKILTQDKRKFLTRRFMTGDLIIKEIYFRYNTKSQSTLLWHQNVKENPRDLLEISRNPR